MRLLMVSQMLPYLPSYDGFRLIPAHLMRQLSRRHEIHLVAPAEPEADQQRQGWAKEHCRSVTLVDGTGAGTPGLPALLLGRPGRIVERLLGPVQQVIRDFRPDVLHLEGPSLAPLARLVGDGLPTLLSAHDSLSLRHRQFIGMSGPVAERFRSACRAASARWFERRWFNAAGRVVVTSSLDRDSLRSAGIDRLAVIPNGVDGEFFRYRPPAETTRIVFTGAMSWPPNEDAADFFARQVLPLVRLHHPAAEFVVAGAAPSPRVRALAAIGGVEVTGTVPDLREWVWGSAVYVSPLRFGAGVKNKILEAMAMGIPIVATPTSLTGTPLESGRHLLVADGRRPFAEAVSRLLEDPQLGAALSVEARRHVEQHYSWGGVAAQFEALYDDLALSLPTGVRAGAQGSH